MLKISPLTVAESLVSIGSASCNPTWYSSSRYSVSASSSPSSSWAISKLAASHLMPKSRRLLSTPPSIDSLGPTAPCSAALREQIGLFFIYRWVCCHYSFVPKYYFYLSSGSQWCASSSPSRSWAISEFSASGTTSFPTSIDSIGPIAPSYTSYSSPVESESSDVSWAGRCSSALRKQIGSYYRFIDECAVIICLFRNISCTFRAGHDVRSTKKRYLFHC